MSNATRRPSLALVLSLPILGLLIIPVFALAISASPSDLEAGLSHPLVGPALWLSLQTSVFSLALVILAGTPLAWWLSTSSGRGAAAIAVAIDLPIVLPPAVVGIGLLYTFGRAGLLGGTLDAMGLQIPFTTAAVVLAQVMVSAPFYIKTATAAFRGVDTDLPLVARTLGHSQSAAFLKVTVPIALPGAVSGAALAWARALGEFGATLLFAGNLTGTTQTMPLAIYSALESDVRVALALALVLAGVSTLLLIALRLGPWAWARVHTRGDATPLPGELR